MKILALTGGIGGAKLALGLSRILDAHQARFVVNTGDDFEHLGLHISPDLDTLCYTLAGIQNRQTGWGREGESWQCLGALEEFGAETWFRLGDRDLATHLLRRTLLNRGFTLSKVTETISSGLGIRFPVFPMSDDPVRTMIETPGGELSFQHYFVRDRCQPQVKGIRFAGAEFATPCPGIQFDSFDAVVICPSNPFVSIEPILAVPGMQDRLLALDVPIVAVSPIVGGRAIKGPTAKMMRELGLEPSATTIAERYRDLLTGFILDVADSTLTGQVQELGMAADVCPTVMVSLDDREALARSVLAFIETLS